VPPSEPSEDVLRAFLAFCRLSRTLSNGNFVPDLSWERLSTLGVVALREPVSISQLASDGHVGASSISRTVAALQQRTLVRCMRDSDDHRSVLVFTTAKGRAALRKGLVRALDRLAALLNKLEDAELDAMAKVIRQARNGEGGS
jgi:DNA-binding MarR family transcriptional regulator